jgi:hypothetical protein
MLVFGHIKERQRYSDIRCDRATALGNPFDLVSEEFRDKVCDAHEAYLKLVIRRYNPKKLRLAEWLMDRMYHHLKNLDWKPLYTNH